MHVPDTGCFITRAGDDQPAVEGKIERVDFLLMAIKNITNAFFGNVPDLRLRLMGLVIYDQRRWSATIPLC